MGEQKPWRSRLRRGVGGVMVTERGGVAGVWMMGALARWMLGRIRRVRETEREKMKETGGRWRKKGLGG